MTMFSSFWMANAGGASGYAVENSARFDSASSQYLSRANSGTPTSTNEFTVSWWWKDATPDKSYTESGNYTHFGMSPTANFFYIGVGAGASAGTYEFNVYSKDSSGTTRTDYDKANLRDPNGWNHFVVAIDTDQSTAGNRKRMYRNGVEVTKRASSDFGSGVTFPGMADGQSMYWAYNGSSGNYMMGYLAQCAFVDGQQLTPSDFGEHSNEGVWRPKDLSGLTFGSYGHWLKFEDSSNVGLDSSGNSNNFTNNNTVIQTNDSPTKNYAVLTPLSAQQSGELSKANTATTSGSDQGMTFASFPVTTGQKVYIEATCSGATSCMTGCVKAISATTRDPTSDFDGLETADGGAGRLLHVGLGDVFNSDGNYSATNYAPNDSVPVTHMIALDLVNDKIYWGDAGVGASGWSNGSGSFNQAFGSAVGVDLTANLDWFFAFRPFGGTIEVNFGATAFTVSPPTGYSSGYSAAIERENRETALTIEDGTAHFQATTYSGNGGSNEINQSGNSQFQPDLVWLKERDGGNHGTLIDAVRGANKGMYPSLSNAEYTESNLSFDADGFSLSATGSAAQVNGSSNTYIGWQWLAGNGTSTPSGGDIATTVSVNQTNGFSIVKWTGNGNDGATIAHGLGAAPSWIIYRKTAAQQWFVQHAGMTGGVANGSSTKQMVLDAIGGEGGPFSGGYIDTIGSSTMTLQQGSSSIVNCNDSGAEYIGWFWCEKPGFSAFGSYEGTGNANYGAFVDLKFKPAFLMVKNVDANGGWAMYDNARTPFNPSNKNINANANAAEYSPDYPIDFLSNGFKVRDAQAYVNTDGQTYIYMAFAEHPFAGTTPSTAY
tara:strand:+ start:19539 stop:22025 length:2487 start_codon:yes stop_codon:yes gene_type:complete